MDIEQARTFLTITAHGSFVEAGRQLHLTQSTISARIRRLEEELSTRHSYVIDRALVLPSQVNVFLSMPND